MIAKSQCNISSCMLPSLGVAVPQVASCSGDIHSKQPWWFDTDYATLYKQSIADPDGFWGGMAEEFLVWDTPFGKVMDCNMEEGIIRWFTGGKLNITRKAIINVFRSQPSSRTAKCLW